MVLLTVSVGRRCKNRIQFWCFAHTWQHVNVIDTASWMTCHKFVSQRPCLTGLMLWHQHSGTNHCILNESLDAQFKNDFDSSDRLNCSCGISFTVGMASVWSPCSPPKASLPGAFHWMHCTAGLCCVSWCTGLHTAQLVVYPSDVERSGHWVCLSQLKYKQLDSRVCQMRHW